jgi:hypothetical protein
MATINEQLDELKGEVTDILPDKWSEVYGYRTAPEKYVRYAMITHMGTEDGTAVTGGKNKVTDFLIVLFAQHDKEEASLEAAERDLNEAESLILDQLTQVRGNGKWLKAVIPYPTIRPRQPRALPETRLAEIPIRLHS